MRKILGEWMRRDDIVVDNYRYKLTDLDSAYIVNPAYEDALKGWFNPKKGEVLVDIGANIGKYVIPFAKRGVKVIAIEPNPEFFDVLMKNIKINGVEDNVKALKLAAGAEKKEVRMYERIFKFPRIVYKPFYANMIPIDEVVDGEDIDWIKVDVDGGEVEVFKGLEKVLRDNKPRIIAELHTSTKNQLLRFLHDLGYEDRLIFRFGTKENEDLYYYFENVRKE